MRHMKKMVPFAAATALAGVGMNTSAQAATGGERVQSNPGLVALVDDYGNQQCSGVLVDSQWVLTYSASMTCSGDLKVTAGDTAQTVNVDGSKLPHKVPGYGNNDPRLSAAMLLHLDKPLKGVKPARLSNVVPKAGEKLNVVAFNGPQGRGHTMSVGKAPISVDGHRDWLSWYKKPMGMTLEGPVDDGALLMRGNDVVAFTQGTTPRGASAEDIAHIHRWISSVTGAR